MSDHHNSEEDIDDNLLHKVIADSISSLGYENATADMSSQDQQQNEENVLSENSQATDHIEDDEKLKESIGEALNEFYASSQNRNSRGTNDNISVADEAHARSEDDRKSSNEDISTDKSDSANLAGSQVGHQISEPSVAHEAADIDLESAIGDAFNSVMSGHEGRLEAGASNNAEKQDSFELNGKEAKLRDDKNNNVQERSEQPDDPDVDLDEAIGRAFSDVFSKKREEEIVNSEAEPPTSSSKPGNNKNSVTIVDGKGDLNKKGGRNMDLDLETAIDTAFNSIAQSSEVTRMDDNNFETGSLIGSALNKVKNLTVEKTHANDFHNLDPSDIARQVVESLNTSTSSTDEMNSYIPKDVLRNLAAEITNRVEEHLQGDTAKRGVNNDTNASLTTESQGNKVHKSSSSAGSALKHSTDRQGEPSQQQGDLENLEMNDILQNALNMALENPQDLLSNLEMESEDKPLRVSETLSSDVKEQKMASDNNQHRIPSSMSSFLSSLKRSNDIDLGDNNIKKADTFTSPNQFVPVAQNIVKQLISKKDDQGPLSIADTLALHRSSGDVPRKGDSQLNSVEDILKSDNSSDSGLISSQISKVLTNLSNKISNSPPGSENNVLHIIRQMTSILTSKNQQNMSFSAEEIIMAYKAKGNDDIMLNSLQLARTYLEENILSSSPRVEAIKIINTVMDAFESQGVSNSGNIFVEGSKNEYVSSMSTSISNVIINFIATKVTGNVSSERPKVDTTEYKERVRLENRERKKKWREENAERNKDNDLRSRVLKKANSIFGEGDSTPKRIWIEDEFTKRRQRRLAKQKRDEEKSKVGSYDDNLGVQKKFLKEKGVDSLVNDPNLSAPIKDMFNLVLFFVQAENTQAALLATSAATAAVATVYVSRNPVDFKSIDSAVGSILNSVMEEIQTSGQADKLLKFTQGSSHLTSKTSSHTLPESSKLNPELTTLLQNSQGSGVLLNRLSATLKGISTRTINTSPSTFDNWQLLSGTRKRNSEYDTHSPKKVHDDSTNTTAKHSTVLSTSDFSNRGVDSFTNWSSPLNVKMPFRLRPKFNTKKQSQFAKASHTSSENSSYGSSPFISHKFGLRYESGSKDTLDSQLSSKMPVPNLRKPGSFQKPKYKRDSTEKAGMLTTMYSTS